MRTGGNGRCEPLCAPTLERGESGDVADVLKEGLLPALLSHPPPKSYEPRDSRAQKQ
jgi:hypothetical protein